MKRLHFIILAVTLLFSQWGSIDHVYHAHKAGDVCDYCITAQSLDHAVSHAVPTLGVVKQTNIQQALPQFSVTKNVTRHYGARAPPRLFSIA
ncbi:MAG: hypothetical protein OEW97_03515 [Gammaproteobacteria bacterium]|nr:hypothetical protein [Gammaproteobacteria bacterium]